MKYLPVSLIRSFFFLVFSESAEIEKIINNDKKYVKTIGRTLIGHLGEKSYL